MENRDNTGKSASKVISESDNEDEQIKDLGSDSESDNSLQNLKQLEDDSLSN